MTRSMTAYARAVGSANDGISWAVEIQSVNRKGLDVYSQLPKELFFLDLKLRKEIAKKLFRGQIHLKVYQNGELSSSLMLNRLKEEKIYWEGVCKGLELSTSSVTLSFLTKQEKECSPERGPDPKVEKIIIDTLNEALYFLIEMKEIEGKAISLDIEKRLETIANWTEELEGLLKKAPELYREKLIKRLSNLFEKVVEDERVLKEIALFSDRIDLSEEIIRLSSHIAQIRGLIKKGKNEVGKTLEFLIQEMLRETNTVAAKSSNIEVTKRAILIKVEIEKIREQVQNIE